MAGSANMRRYIWNGVNQTAASWNCGTEADRSYSEVGSASVLVQQQVNPSGFNDQVAAAKIEVDPTTVEMEVGTFGIKVDSAEVGSWNEKIK